MHYDCWSMADATEKSALERFADVLLEHGVEFIVIGGQAENLVGSPRTTFDVDLCYRRNQANLERLAQALSELKPSLRGAPPGLPCVCDAPALAMGCNYTFTTALGDLDLLGHVEPLGDYDAISPRVLTYDVGGRILKVLNLDDQIRVKQHINRAKDRDALLQLLAIKAIRDAEGPSAGT